MYGYKINSYVPEPEPVTVDRVVACHYYPGWKKGGTDLHNGFADIKEYPERTPLLGYYDEADPEVSDWEIKWAVEHGVNCFVYCWYRYQDNLGKPLKRSSLRFGHAIHEGLFKARYRNYIKFAIMWECQSKRWGTAADADDMVNNLLPFWVENYFSKENYLLYDGKPVLFVYSQDDLIDALGSPEKLNEAFSRCSEEIKKFGFPGIYYSCMSSRGDAAAVRGWLKNGVEDLSIVERYKSCGFDSAFQYGWAFYRNYLSESQLAEYNKELMAPSELVIEHQLRRIKARIEQYPDYFIYTNSVMRDSRPWGKIFNIDYRTSHALRWVLKPEEWRILLRESRKLIDSLPPASPGRRIFMIDNWNEWSEGHYVAPHLGGGFKYLQAIREEFTKRDNLPDYRTPQLLELGPYDSEWLGEQ